MLAHALTLIREGLAALCQSHPQFRVVAQCAEGATALSLIQSREPDIAILDIDLPDLFNLELIRKLRADAISTRVVVLSGQEDRRTVVKVLRAGVNGFLLNSGPAEELFQAFEQILDGGIYVSPSLKLDKIFSSGQKSAPPDPFEALSAREHQVFSLLVEGARAKDIGARLGLNPKTVDTYRVNLMRKLDIHHIAGLVKFAMKRDLASSDGSEFDTGIQIAEKWSKSGSPKATERPR